MRFTRIKFQSWELKLDCGKVFIGTSKKDLLAQLEEYTKAKK